MTKEKKKLALHWKILIGMALGVIWSVIVTGSFGGIEKGEVPVAQLQDIDNTKALVVAGEIDEPSFLLNFDNKKSKVDSVNFVDGKSYVFIQSAYDLRIEEVGSDSNVSYSFKGNVLSGLTSFTDKWVKPWGDIFIRILKFIAVPLVLFSIIIGVSGLRNMSKLRRMGLKTLGMYLLTTLFAVSVGLVVVNLFKPGESLSDDYRTKRRIQYEIWAQQKGVALKDDIRMLESSDAKIQSLIAEAKMEMEEEPSDANKTRFANATKSKEEGPLAKVVEMVPENLISAFQNPKMMLQVIFFAIFFGLCMTVLPEDKMKPVRSFFDGVNEVFLKMVDYAMKAAPFFVFCLMAGVISKMANSPAQLTELLVSLGWYALVVVGGLVFMLIIYPFLVSIFVKGLSFKDFIQKILPAQMTAFSTSSSAATLPVTMNCVEERIGVKEEVTSFVLPVGATVNMDGTSLYQAVAVIFLAQMHMIDLTLTEQLMIVLTATLASIGSAAVPSAGLVMLMIVLQSVELNPFWIAIILPVDRILDMCRTVVNVTGDASVATIIAKSEDSLELKTESD